MVVRILLIPTAFNFHHPLLNMAALIQEEEITPSLEWQSYVDSQEILRLDWSLQQLGKLLQEMQTHLLYTKHFFLFLM